jgi:D-alanyl-D-alanine carboxypeptidase
MDEAKDMSPTLLPSSNSEMNAYNLANRALHEEMDQIKSDHDNTRPNPKLDKLNNHLAAYLGNQPFLSAQSWAIYDCRRGKLLAGKNEALRRECASITKVMTFYTSL